MTPPYSFHSLFAVAPREPFRASAPFRVVQFAVANPTPSAADHPSPTDPLNQPNEVYP